MVNRLGVLWRSHHGPMDDLAGSAASSKAAFDEDPDLPGAQGKSGKSLKIPSGN